MLERIKILYTNPVMVMNPSQLAKKARNDKKKQEKAQVTRNEQKTVCDDDQQQKIA